MKQWLVIYVSSGGMAELYNVMGGDTWSYYT
jgi:hypothetical protein